MPIRLHGSQESPEQRYQAALGEFKNSHLAESLKEAYRQHGNHPVEMEMAVPEFNVINQMREGDSLGCVVCCYRMGINAQDGHDRGQQVTRQELESRGMTEGRGGMADLSTVAARIAGVRNPMAFGDFKDSLSPEERQQLEGKSWAAAFALALEKGNFAITALPMSKIYKDTGSTINHAVVIKGVRYLGGEDYKFLINDPLERAAIMDLEPFVKENADYMGGLVVLAPHKNVFPERRMKMKLTYRKVQPENSRFVPGQIQRGGETPRVKIRPTIKIRKPDQKD